MKSTLAGSEEHIALCKHHDDSKEITTREDDTINKLYTNIKQVGNLFLFDSPDPINFVTKTVFSEEIIIIKKRH